MNDNARLMVRFEPPRFGKPVEVWLNIDPYMAEPFRPLDRNRELYGASPFAVAFTKREREMAAKQLMDRAKLSEYLAPIIASALADAITKQDAQNGYEPSEL